MGRCRDREFALNLPRDDDHSWCGAELSVLRLLKVCYWSVLEDAKRWRDRIGRRGVNEAPPSAKDWPEDESLEPLIIASKREHVNDRGLRPGLATDTPIDPLSKGMAQAEACDRGAPRQANRHEKGPKTFAIRGRVDQQLCSPDSFAGRAPRTTFTRPLWERCVPRAVRFGTLVRERHLPAKVAMRGHIQGCWWRLPDESGNDG